MQVILLKSKQNTVFEYEGLAGYLHILECFNGVKVKVKVSP